MKIFLLTIFLGIAPLAFAQTENFKPVEVNILLEAGSSAPAWYRGASLPTFESKTKISALIFLNGKRLTPANFTYNWTIDGNLERGLSGKGKEGISYSFPKSKGSASVIELEVLDTKNKRTGKAEIVIDPKIPEVLFYEKNSSGPITSRTVARETISPDSKFTVKAIPFFMNSAKKSDLQFIWFQDSQPQNAVDGEPDAYVIEAKPGSGGQNATFKVFVTNTKSLLEKIENSLYVEVR